MAHPFNGVPLQNQGIQHLQKVWEITNDPDAEFNTKVDRLLNLERDHFDLPYGFVSHVDVASNTQTIEHAQGDHELLQPGETCPLSESYCRKTIQQPDGIFRIDDAHADGFDTDPAYRRFELGTYVGATIKTGGETYGTVCFASSDPREKRVTESEMVFLEMLATWVSNAVQHQRTQAQLRQNVEQIEELAGIVSHDLRNPLTVAQGQVELLGQSIQESLSRIEKAHTRMDALIDDILTLTRIDEPVENPSPVPLQQCVADSWENCRTSEATLTLAFEGMEVYADEPRLKRLFENLFRNAIEHGGRAVSVEVGVTETGFYIADDGPGIPADERESVFQAGYSERSENTGFGLSIVRYMVDAHDWEITITDSVTGGARFDVTGVESPAE
jgi:signal transduction histidine kinase